MFRIIPSFICLFLVLNLFGQNEPILQWEVFEDTLPEPVSNNAVVWGCGNFYSFGGLDSTKSYSGMHLKSWKISGGIVPGITVEPLEDLPDTLGKIAASASCIDSIIYIVGGYHVYANGNEKSSKRVHRFDCRTDTYLNDAADLPVPIDDQVQAVWRDSLIYVITGWSNNGNEDKVQIYNPAADTWTVHTQTWTNSIYSSFGASGTIIGDTIYYLGGARYAANFPIQDYLRIGIIDSADPSIISWSDTLLPGKGLYRAACFNSGMSFNPKNRPIWVGGSRTTYNYDGLAYAGGVGVEPSKTVQIFVGDSMATYETYDQLPMDLRGVAENDISGFFTIGGMKEGQEVSNEVIFNGNYIWHGVDDVGQFNLSIYPVPATQVVSFESSSPILKVEAYNLQGQLVSIETGLNIKSIDLSNIQESTLVLQVETSKGSVVKKVVRVVVD